MTRDEQLIRAALEMAADEWPNVRVEGGLATAAVLAYADRIRTIDVDEVLAKVRTRCVECDCEDGNCTWIKAGPDPDDVALLVKAAKEATKSLSVISAGVFNDNGDVTISSVPISGGDQTQAYYRLKRLRSALAAMTDQLDTAAIRETQPSPEPVAWQYRYADPLTGKPIWRMRSDTWNGQRAKEGRPLYTTPQPDELARLRAENERLRYVLDGVAGAIDTGRNEPLQIWRDQINIARAALTS